MRVVGVDPGLSKGKGGGGLALSEFDGPKGFGLQLEPMPLLTGGGLDEQKLCELLRAWAPDLVVLEKLMTIATGHTGNAKGLRGVLNGAAAWGFIRGVVIDQGVRLVEVAPQTWQAWAWREGVRTGVLTARPSAGNTKLAAAQVAKLWFPGVDFRASARSRCNHTGLIDASLIALHGRRALAGGAL